VLALVAQQLVEGVVGAREGGFAGVAGAEGKGLAVRSRKGEAVGMNVEPLLAASAPGDHYRITLAYPPRLHDLRAIVAQDQRPVNPSFPDQYPAPCAEMKILREVGGDVEALGEDAVGRGRSDAHRRRSDQFRPGEIRGGVGREKRHAGSPRGE
jgi:hypothetical protein